MNRPASLLTTLRTPVLLIAAGLAVCSVLILNGGPLYYFDTAGYIEQGISALRSLGLASTPEEAGAGQAILVDGISPTGVTGSRAIVYGLWLTAAVLGLGFGLAMLPQLAVLLAGTILAVRGMGGSISLAAVALIVASAGALPFYAAYLMPDIFAPLLILIAALLTARAETLSWPMLLGCISLGALAVTTHLSHLGIAVLLIPASLLLRLLFLRHRMWIAPLCIALIAGAGLAERALFQIVVEQVEAEEVVYQPFMTARLIVDGPGMDYLSKVCPQDDAACPLYKILTAPGDPARLTATNIIFETRSDLGSFQLLDPEIQKTIAADQRMFFLRVLSHYPVATLRALLANTLSQAVHVSINQTLPDRVLLTRIGQTLGDVPPALEQIAFLDAKGWPNIIESWHQVLYGAALMALLIGALHPRAAGPVRLFSMMILLGLLANAFICGAFSQPAPRYGARVAWLLPFAAVLVWGMIRAQDPPAANSD